MPLTALRWAAWLLQVEVLVDGDARIGKLVSEYALRVDGNEIANMKGFQTHTPHQV